MKFSDITATVLEYLAASSTDTEATEVKRAANRVIQNLCSQYRFTFMRRRGVLVTVDNYSTGTATPAAGSRDIAGTGTAWTLDHVGGQLQFTGEDEWYEIASVSSGTALKLRNNYVGSLAVATAYSVVKDYYRLPTWVHSIYSARELTNDTHLRVMPKWELDEAHPDPSNDGEPRTMVVGLGAAEFDLYSTGTISVTDGGGTVTGVGTTWASEMEGMEVRFDNEDRTYQIDQVASTTSLTLMETYQGAGTNLSGASYAIGPRAQAEIQLYPRPDDVYRVVYTYNMRHPYLVGDNEHPLIPSEYHDVIVNKTIAEIKTVENEGVGGDLRIKIREGENRLRQTYKIASPSGDVVSTSKSPGMASWYGRHLPGDWGVVV
jgi:hypothetical protein